MHGPDQAGRETPQPPGPDDAFLALRTQLLQLARRIVRSPADAEDIVQDAYVRWRTAAPGMLGDARAWLSTVVSHLAIDHVRRQRWQQRTHAEPQTGDEHPAMLQQAAEIAPEDTIDLRWATYCMHAYLNPTERAALVLHDALDVDYEELSGLLRRKVPACRQIIHRARLRLARVAHGTGPARLDRRMTAFLVALLAADAAGLVGMLVGDL